MVFLTNTKVCRKMKEKEDIWGNWRSGNLADAKISTTQCLVSCAGQTGKRRSVNVHTEYVWSQINGNSEKEKHGINMLESECFINLNLTKTLWFSNFLGGIYQMDLLNFSNLIWWKCLKFSTHYAVVLLGNWIVTTVSPLESPFWFVQGKYTKCSTWQYVSNTNVYIGEFLSVEFIYW